MNDEGVGMRLRLAPLWHRLRDLWRNGGTLTSLTRWWRPRTFPPGRRAVAGPVVQEGDTMVREMKVLGLTVDRESNTPIVVLKDPKSETVLPIVIGRFEASAINSELEQISFARPMTHDLIKNLIGHLGVRVNKVEVCDLREDTFYAWIYLMVNSKEMRIDARPSDALAIALRTRSPIYVNEKVLEKSGAAAPMERDLQEQEDEEARAWADILGYFDPRDFRSYDL
jgi:bifunctional DNase/RNase